MTIFVFTKFNGRNRLDVGSGEYFQWQKQLQHCIVTYSQELNYAYTKYIELI